MSTTFAELGLHPALVEAVRSAGYEAPTPIQERAIPVLLQGQDLIGQAQTGTGKTAAYGLPLLQSVEEKGVVQALVLVPTRELAIQVSEQLKGWSRQVMTLAIYGGQPILKQFQAIRRGPQVVVATPGRLIDHLERETLNLDLLRFCVLDEADEMMDQGFEEELEMILDRLPESCHMALFSATFPAKIKKLAGRHMSQAQKVTIEASQRTVDNIEQFYCLVRKGKKAQAIGRLIDHQDPGPSLIFCRTRAETQSLTDELRRRGYAAECLHGEMDQSERERVMDRFRLNQCRILVATDIAARGLDVEGITHVFNYDIPWDLEAYIHRVGRTARAGRSGTAITVIEPSQQRQLQRIERESGAQFKAYPVPSLDQIASGRHKRFAHRIRLQMQDPDCQQQLGLVRSLCKDADPMAVAAAALQALWQTQFGGLSQDESEEELAIFDRTFCWVSLSVGRREEIGVPDLLRTIQEETGLNKCDLGKIILDEARSLIEVPADKADAFLLKMRRLRIKGKRIKADLSAPPAVIPRSFQPRGKGRPPRGGPFTGRPPKKRGRG